MDNNKLIVTAAPHITSTDTTQKIMQRVCLALCPTLIASVIIFGINALILVAVTVVACVFFEWGYCKPGAAPHPDRLGDHLRHQRPDLGGRDRGGLRLL